MPHVDASAWIVVGIVDADALTDVDVGLCVVALTWAVAPTNLKSRNLVTRDGVA